MNFDINSLPLSLDACLPRPRSGPGPVGRGEARGEGEDEVFPLPLYPVRKGSLFAPAIQDGLYLTG
jgi:hypothetical protein